MKTKFTFRVLFATMFVLGAMAVNAQTKIYVHQKGGADKTYNIADVDSISFNPLFIPTIPVTGVTLNNTTLSLIAGQTSTLTATVEPANASDKSVTWSSDNEAVARVSTTGLVTAVAASADPANITVTTNDGGFTKSCAVTVTAASVGDNLLKNPGFLDPDDGSATLQDWTPMSIEEVTADAQEMQDANPSIATKGLSTLTTAIQRSVDGFWTTAFVNPTTLAVDFTLTPYNGQAARLYPAGNDGIYQLVSVTPGKTYAFSAHILLHRQNSNNQAILKNFLRIKTGDGASTITKVLIADADGVVQEGSWMYITGSVTIPSDATYNTVRFQITQVDFNQPNATGSRSSGTVIDDCDFHLIN